MKTITVHYNGWGEYWPLGVLADNGRTLLFEYSRKALEQQLEFSPLHLKLRAQAYGGFPLHQDRLPGLIADSLPDGWGRLLMDKLFRRPGINPADLSPLDRLAVIGERGMGAAFGAQRFDVEGAYRVPTQTLAAVFDADFRLPGALDYIKFLRITDRLTNDQREVKKAYERAVFNVVFHNRDDHSRNFSFRLGQDRRWRLAPAYDLTFSEGYGGEHNLDVCGEGRHISRTQLLELARQGGLSVEWAATAIDRIANVAMNSKDHLTAQPIRKATVAVILANVNSGLTRLVR